MLPRKCGLVWLVVLFGLLAVDYKPRDGLCKQPQGLISCRFPRGHRGVGTDGFPIISGLLCLLGLGHATKRIRLIQKALPKNVQANGGDSPLASKQSIGGESPH